MINLHELIDRLREKKLAAYRASPGDLKEHFGIEQTVLAGGYGFRRVLELVQNGAYRAPLDSYIGKRMAGTSHCDSSPAYIS
jgi:hypothetical protein